MVSCAFSEKVRTVPVMTISAGMTLGESGEPPRMEPIDTTAISTAGMLRPTTFCSARQKCACAMVTSVARCGVEPP